MELINTLGLDWRLLLWQVVTFFVLLFILKKYAYGPVLNALEERQKKIEKGISDAEKAEVALKDADQEKSKLLQEAAEQASQIVSDAKKSSEQIKEESLQKTKEDTERLVVAGKERIKQEQQNMFRDAESEVQDLMKQAMEKVLDRSITEKDHDLLAKAATDAMKR